MQILVACVTGALALIGLNYLCIYALYKIYVDPLILMVISNITVAAVSSLTTLLVGRTVSQLIQPPPDEPMKTEIVNPPDQPVPVVPQPERNQFV